MDAKEYLSRAFYLNRQIKAKQKCLDWIRDIAPGPSVVFSDEPRVPGNPRNSAVENAALRVVALEEEIAADILQLVEVVKEIEAAIKRIDSIECRTILEMRYLSFMDWEEIAGRMGYTLRHTFYLHKNSIRTLSGIL